MSTISPAFTLFVGSLILAFVGLFFWNLHLHNLLRTARAKERGDLAPAPVSESIPPGDHIPPPPAVPVAFSPRVESPAKAVGPGEPDWQHRLAQAEQQLQLVQQELAALSYSVSHDLRAPLRAVDGFSQALAEDYGQVLASTARGYLQRVRANTAHMVALIEDLLSLSRLARAPLQREFVEIGPIVQLIVAGLRKVDPERVVKLEVQPGIRAFADRGLLDNVLRGLLDNAWKFTARKPDAHVSVRAAIGWQPHGESEIVYEVRDDGAGFDMNYAGKLFGAFQRMHTAEEFPGNGIGLAAVQRIVRRHGGRVWAEAVPDQGTAIFFTLGEGEEISKDLALQCPVQTSGFPGEPGAKPLPAASPTLT